VPNQLDPFVGEGLVPNRERPLVRRSEDDVSE